MEHGAIRVIGVNHASAVAGRMFICDNGEWRAVCDEGWGIEDTQVVCRQLGYDTQGKQFLCNCTHQHIILINRS